MRILFITANRLGDAVLTTGLLDHLVQRYPETRFTIACGPVAQDLFRAVPRLEKLIPMAKRSWNRHWIGLWRETVGVRWALVVDLRNSLVSRLLRAERVTRPPSTKTGLHKVLELAQVLDLSPPPPPRLWLDARAEEEAARFLGPHPGPLLALGPTANWPVKQWPVERFLELARRLTGPQGPLANARVLVLAAPAERDQAAPLLEGLPPEKRLDGIGLNLLTAGACLKACRLFVGNDSGLTHLAAAAGAPTLGLFGPGWEKIYGPWGPRAAFVRTPESTEELLARLPSRAARSPNLMESLTVEAVETAAHRLLEEKGARTAP